MYLFHASSSIMEYLVGQPEILRNKIWFFL